MYNFSFPLISYEEFPVLSQKRCSFLFTTKLFFEDCFFLLFKTTCFYEFPVVQKRCSFLFATKLFSGDCFSCCSKTTCFLRISCYSKATCFYGFPVVLPMIVFTDFLLFYHDCFFASFLLFYIKEPGQKTYSSSRDVFFTFESSKCKRP